jgi:hypothetical protein
MENLVIELSSMRSDGVVKVDTTLHSSAIALLLYFSGVHVSSILYYKWIIPLP